MIRTLTLSLVIALIATSGLHASNNGKTGRTATTSAGCGSCHSSTASAAVTLSIPGSTGNSMNVAAGTKVNLSVLIAHTATGRTAGVNIAVKTDMTGTTDAGTLTAAGTNLKLSGTELTHSSPKTMSSNSATFDFAWTAPTTPGTYYVRAVGLSTNNNGVEDTGDLWARLPQFTLVVAATAPTPAITVLAPNGGEQWQAGSAHTITWTSSNVTSVAIDWSSAGASGPWTTVAASVTAATGSYAWTTPNTATTNGFVRVRDVSTTTATTVDVSNAAFTITTTPPPASLSLTAPVGGATLRVGTVVPISWKFTSVVNVMLEYSTTGNTGPWKNIVASTPAATGTYMWTVPTDSSMSVFVRVSSVETPTLTAMNSINVMILPVSTAATFVLTVPQGSEVYHVGDHVAIRWSGSAVKLLMSEDEDDDSDSSDDEGDDDGDDDGDDSDTTGSGGGGSTDTTTTGSGGGGGTDTTTTGGGGGTDTTTTGGGGGGTDTTTTSGGSDTTSAPNVSLRIEWSADGPAGPWEVIAEGVSAKKAQFNWVAPNHPTATAFVRLSNMLNTSQESINKIAFTILGSTTDDGDTAEIETVHITAPRTGSKLTPRKSTTITWETRATRAVNVEWDACGDGWQTITSNIHANIGHYQWNVPSHADGLGVIRIVDAASPKRILEVSGAFMVVNPILTDVRTQDEDGRALIAPQPMSTNRSVMIRKPQSTVDHCEVIAMTGQMVQQIDLSAEQTEITSALAPGAYVIRWFTPTGALSFTTSLMIIP